MAEHAKTEQKTLLKTSSGLVERGTGSYVPSLDGIRALAVLAVLVYHTNSSWLPGGLLGVTIFFVLSGYLITGLLISEFDRDGKIDLPHFWLRRARRLLPAVITVLCCVVILTALLSPPLFARAHSDVLPSLLFYANWAYIFQDISYFDALVAPSPLTHFWSLGIEEQFYIVWPLLLFALFKLKTPRKVIAALIALLALASAGEMAWLFDPAADPSRVYYGTDTRAFSLLIGAFLAFVLPLNKLRQIKGEHEEDRPAPRRWGITWDAIAYLSLAILLVAMVLIGGTDPIWYYGGIAGVSVLTGLLILGVARTDTTVEKVFSFKPLVWVGKRSYGIYLWHYPLLLLVTPDLVMGAGMDAGARPWWWCLVQWTLIFLVAALSYHFIEDPIRHGTLGRYYKSIRSKETALKSAILKRLPYIILTPCLIAAAVTLFIITPIQENELAADESYQQVAGGGSGFLGKLRKPKVDTTEVDGLGVTDVMVKGWLGDDPESWTLLLIGDSVPLGAQGEFLSRFPASYEDAEVSRSLYAFDGVWANYSQYEWDGVLIALATNSAITYDQMQAAIDAVGPDTYVYLLGARMDLDCREPNNRILAQLAEDNRNVLFLDWYSYSEGHGEWFGSDGIHLTEQGKVAYVDMIQETLSAGLWHR